MSAPWEPIWHGRKERIQGRREPLTGRISLMRVSEHDDGPARTCDIPSEAAVGLIKWLGGTP